MDTISSASVGLLNTNSLIYANYTQPHSVICFKDACLLPIYLHISLISTFLYCLFYYRYWVHARGPCGTLSPPWYIAFHFNSVTYHAFVSRLANKVQGGPEKSKPLSRIIIKLY